MSVSSKFIFPPRPGSVSETGLSLGFLADLALKLMRARDVLSGREIASALKLPFANVIDKSLDHLRRELLVEVKGSAGIGESAYQYVLSRAGQTRARGLMDRNQYVGPAPVGLDAYTKMVKTQTLAGQTISQETLRRALAHLVLSDATLNQLGPAINAGRSVFIFGHTGNGKTSIGLAIEAMLPGAIWIPYAVSVDEQIIQVFDASHHRAIALEEDDNASANRKGLLSYLNHGPTGAAIPKISKGEKYDERWTLVQRPLIVSGGEMTLKDLDLVLDSSLKYYQAPQQMKANGGAFLVDDLGRQRVSSRDILNRWIIPLEKRVDYMTLAIGTKIDVPFDALIVFATNLNPEEIADEAFLRRLRYKIHIPDPTWEEYREIFKREAAKRNIPYSEDGFRSLVAEAYAKPKREPRGVHPRDLLDELVDIARFANVPPTLSKELVDRACQTYFLKK